MRIVYLGLLESDSENKFKMDKKEQIVSYINSTLLDYTMEYTLKFIRENMESRANKANKDNYKKICEDFLKDILEYINYFKDSCDDIISIYETDHKFSDLVKLLKEIPVERTIKFNSRIESSGYGNTFSVYNKDTYKTLLHYKEIIAHISRELNVIFSQLPSQFEEQKFVTLTIPDNNPIVIRKKSTAEKLFLAFMHCIKQVRQARWLSWFENYLYKLVINAICQDHYSAPIDTKFIVAFPEFFFVDFYDMKGDKPKGYVKPFYEDIAKYFAGLSPDIPVSFYMEPSFNHRRLLDITENPHYIIFAGTMLWKTKNERTIYTNGSEVVLKARKGYTAFTTDTFYNTAVVFAAKSVYFTWDKQFISLVDKTEGIKVIKKHEEPDRNKFQFIKSVLSYKYNVPCFDWYVSGCYGCLLTFFLSICKDFTEVKNEFDVDIHMLVAHDISLKRELFQGKYLFLSCDGNGTVVCFDIQGNTSISPLGKKTRHYFYLFEYNIQNEIIAEDKTSIPLKNENSFYDKVVREGLNYEDKTEAAALFSDEEAESINLTRIVTTQVSVCEFNEDHSVGILKIAAADYEREYNIVLYPLKDDKNQQYIKAELKENNTPFDLSDVLELTANASSDLLSRINLTFGSPKECLFYFYESDYREYNISFDINERIDLIDKLISFDGARFEIIRKDDLYRYTLSAVIDIEGFNLEFGIVSGTLDLVQVYIKPAAPNKSFPSFKAFAGWLFGGDLDEFNVNGINLLDLAITKVSASLKAEDKIMFKEFVIGTKITIFSLVFYVDVCLYDKTISGFMDTDESKPVSDIITDIFSPSKIQLPIALKDICTDKATFSADLNNKTYSIDFSVNGVWDCGIFKIEKLEMIVENCKDTKSVMFTGSLTLFEEIETDVSVHNDNGLWELCGSVSITDSKSLYDLFESIGWDCPSIFKIIVLERINILYADASNKFTFDCSASLIVDSFIMKFSVAAEKNSSKAEYKGKMSIGVINESETNMLDTVFTVEFDKETDKNILSIKWQQESALSVTDFCHALGFEEFELPEFLDITITDLSGKFDFDSSIYLFQASTSSGDVIYIKSELVSGKREFIFGVSVKADIGMSGLPVVGNLDVMDKIHIKDMRALILTSDYENLTIHEMDITNLSLDKGLYLLSDLVLIDKKIPINIPITSQKEASDNSASEKSKELTVDINKNLGPFSLKKIGASYSDKTAYFLMYASFNENTLSFALDNLGIGYNIAEKKPDFMLKGLSVDVKTSALTIGGGFIKSNEHTYKGSLLIGLSSLNVTAVGAYTSGETDSVFAFALLRADIGGPPCFFITGLAMGFGYNLNLNLPGIDELDSFPFLRAADGELSEDQIFNDEKKYFPSEKGEKWIAAGITFNSFKMVDSAALLTFKFGNATEIDLIGKSIVDIPHNVKNPIGHAALLLKASIKPESGLAAIEAALSKDCYILSKNCRLTGSFAFYTWYSGEHSGDFVLTLGGYRRSYEKPDHYPSAQRLGFNWNVSSNLNAQGELYFALTPSCIMAGGALKLQFTTSCVEAWFDASLDIYIQWKPYYYEFDIGVLIGVKVKLKLFTIKVEIGCTLSIWGPDFGGLAHVKLWIISFSIPFNNSDKPVKPSIDTEEFVSSFLPPVNSETKLSEVNSAAYGGCVISVNKGLLKEFNIDDKEKGWKICPESFEVSAKSSVPAKKAVLQLYNEEVYNFSSSADTYLRPCNDSKFNSTLYVALKRADGVKIENKFTVSEITENLPSALWANSTCNTETISAQTGLIIRPEPKEYYEFLFEEDFQELNISMHYSPPPAIECKKYDGSKSFEYISKINETPASNRNEILKCLGEEFQNVSIDMLAKDPGAVFSEKPLVKTIGGL